MDVIVWRSNEKIVGYLLGWGRLSDRKSEAQ